MSGDIADDQDDMTIAYMLGFERGKDAAAATITAQAQEIERLKGALGEIASEPTVRELCAEFGQDYEGDWQDGYDHCVAIARAAIRKETT